MIRINNIDELIKWQEKGFHPLYEWRSFLVNRALRVSVQNYLFAGTEFSRGAIAQSNQQYYYHCWKIHPEKHCENCLVELQNYSATFISHILPRSAYPEYALDPRNHNLLCKKCHSKWESKYNYKMLIYPTNLLIIDLIKKH